MSYIANSTNYVCDTLTINMISETLTVHCKCGREGEILKLLATPVWDSPIFPTALECISGLVLLSDAAS